MASFVQYRITVTCDTCGKKDVRQTDGSPPPAAPEHWIQGAPSGTMQTKEFCSAECLSKWQPEQMPWEDGATS